MLIQFVTALGVLAALTMVPGPDMAVVTKRAVASGWRDGLRTVGGNWLGARVVTYLGPNATAATRHTPWRRPTPCTTSRTAWPTPPRSP